MSKLIDYGGFGCVYYPAIAPDLQPTKNKKFLSKLQLLDYTAANELKIGNIIFNIENYSAFFSPLLVGCKVKLQNMTSELIDECPIVEKYKTNSVYNKTDQFTDIPKCDEYYTKKDTKIDAKKDTKKDTKEDQYQFILAYLEHIENIDFYHLFDSFLDYGTYFFQIINNYYYLINSLQILNENNIVHYDLKVENILFDANKQLPIIIDFGLSFVNTSVFDDKKNFDLDILKNVFYTHSSEYSLWCPEIQVITYIINKYKSYKDFFNLKILTKDILNTIFSEYVYYNSALELFSEDFKKNYIKSLNSYYSKFIGQTNLQVISELYKFNSTWDMYSLSIMFLKILNREFKTTKGNFVNNNLNVLLVQIFLLNLSPFPKKRLSFSQIKDLIYKITLINKENISKYSQGKTKQNTEVEYKIIDNFINVTLNEKEIKILENINKEDQIKVF